MLRFYKALRLIILFLNIFLFSGLTALSQKKEPHSNVKVFGNNFKDANVILGTQLTFPEHIYQTYLDTARGFLTVQLRGISKNGKSYGSNGTIVYYDLNKKEIKWERSISYLGGSIMQNRNLIVQTVIGKNYKVDLDNGKLTLELKNAILYVDPEENYGFGYSLESLREFGDEIEGIDFNNGNILWSRVIPNNYGWNGIYFKNDSIRFVVSSGLHRINIRNGNGWSYPMHTGEKEGAGQVRTEVSNDYYDLNNSVFLNPFFQNVIYDVCSNLVFDSLNLYFASKNQIICINDHHGKVVWKTELPQNIMSKSSLFIDDNSVFLINKGLAIKGYSVINYGKPFIARYDRATGDRIFLSLINLQDDPILSIKKVDDVIYLLFKNRIASYSLTDGKLIHEKDFSTGNFGAFKYFIRNDAFIESKEDEFVYLNQLDTTKVFVFTKDKKALEFDHNLNFIQTIERQDLFAFHFYNGDLLFLAGIDKIWVLNASWQKVAEIDASSNSFLIGETLYERKEDRFNVIDLSELFKEN